MARPSNQKLELFVGTFIVAGLILIAGMILKVTSIGLFGETYVVVVRMSHIGDLQEGAPVKRGGVQIGRVTDIALQKDHIRIVTEIDSSVVLTSDSVASIETAGVVGDTFLEFSQGVSRETLNTQATTLEAALKETEEHPEGQNVVEGMGSVSMNEILHRIETIGVEIISITKNVNDIIGDEKVKTDIKEAIANTNAATIQARRLLKSLNQTSDNIEQASADVVVAAKGVKDMVAEVEKAVNQTVGDPQNRERINETIANVHALSGTLSKNREALDQTIENVRLLSADARAIGFRVREITQELGPDKGIMPLFTDEKVWKEFTSLYAQLEALVSEKGLLDLLQLKRYADEIAAKYLDEMKSKHIPPEELYNRVVELLRRHGLGDVREAKQIIERSEDPFYRD